MKDKGIKIALIPRNSIGLTIGLNPEEDIPGHKISGTPDPGAFELGK